jgi:hypothetical protein
MKDRRQIRNRRVLGQISTKTKGPPGLHMELSGQWNKDGLTG